MCSTYPSCFMNYSSWDIRNYMKENNINNNLDINKPIKSLGIYKIDKKDINRWFIYIKGPKESPYKKGAFKLSIDFPETFPTKKPEIRFINKIYHLQVSESNGHILAGFIFKWHQDTSITECLVGIYLLMALEQNPDSPYSGAMAREYSSNRAEFNRKAEEWTIKYASPSPEDIILINKMNNDNSPEKKIEALENKYNLLETQIRKFQNELIQMKSLISEKDSKIDFYKDKYIKLLEELKDIKDKYPIVLKPGEKMISVIFKKSKDFISSIICKDSNIFFEVENSLYQKYPKFRESERFFTFNGNRIEKNKTLKENGINDSDIIIIN